MFVVARVKEAMELSPADLQLQYGVEVHSYDDEIIFHCRAGRRGQAACDIATAAGYKKYPPGFDKQFGSIFDYVLPFSARNYKGGITDWNSRK